MEFHEKLQELRRNRGLTQEELAACLYVSRTAVSKWESGRGYPSIDSLKAISKFYSVSIDELLSGEEALSVAEVDHQQKRNRMLDWFFGLLDISAVVLIFLPLFAQRMNGTVEPVSLTSLNGITAYLKMCYWIGLAGISGCGIAAIALQNLRNSFWLRYKRTLSLCIGCANVLLYIMSLQPYAAAYGLVILGIKVMLLLKKP